MDKNGKWCETVCGKVIETIHWNEWWKYRCSKSNSDACKDYEPDATPWNELFEINNFPKGWRNTVESLAYSIQIIEEEE